MKFRIGIVLFVIACAFFALSRQLNLVNVNALERTNAPSTYPSTYPTALVILSGKVSYIINNKKIPAEKVTVNAENLSTRKIKKVKTDNKGKYAFSLDIGVYKVHVQDKNGTKFTPKNIDVILDFLGVSGINFQGKL